MSGGAAGAGQPREGASRVAGPGRAESRGAGRLPLPGRGWGRGGLAAAAATAIAAMPKGGGGRAGGGAALGSGRGENATFLASGRGSGPLYRTGENPAPRHLVGRRTGPRCLSKGLVPPRVGCGWPGGIEVSFPPPARALGAVSPLPPLPHVTGGPAPPPGFQVFMEEEFVRSSPRCSHAEAAPVLPGRALGPWPSPGAPQPAHLGALTAAAGQEQLYEAAGLGPASGAPSAPFSPFLWLRGAGTDLFL